MFKVSARTLLHLGAELISSDAVAFYELVKNAFDAKSKRAKIEVVALIDFDEVEALRELIHEEQAKLRGRKKKPSQEQVDALLDTLRENLTLDADNPELEQLLEALDGARTLEALEHELDEANYIIVSDEGEGMTLQELREVYLTIGTPVRLKQRQAQTGDGRPILGEKGIGRLSVMRLGWKVRVETTKRDTSHWNLLEIDWRRFQELDKTVEQIDIAPERGKKKKDPSTQGTRIRISVLAAPWSKEKLENIAKLELARFMDPFAKKQPFEVMLRYNSNNLVVPRMQDLLFAKAHMKIEGVYRVNDGEPRLECQVTMKEPKMGRMVTGSEKILRTCDQLRSVAQTSQKVLQHLGPFRFVMYWFNRRVLTAIDGIGDAKTVKALVAQWAGIMLFRDGFRIHPYGNQDDDWLNFDKTALGSGGYKLNKVQFIGKIDITRAGNPQLIDQANREGLKDTREKEALVAIIYDLVQREIRRIITQWEKESKKAEPATVIADKLESLGRAQKQLVVDIERLRDTPGGKDIATRLGMLLHEQVQPALQAAATFVEEAQDEREMLFHLAGIGLMLEVVAHELKRTVGRALATVTKLTKLESSNPKAGEKAHALFLTLEQQLKALEKRVRILDPHSTSARQRKETFDVVKWTKFVLDAHADEFEQGKVDVQCVVVDSSPEQSWSVHMVKGIFIQILENLVSNSIYWLANRRSAQKAFRPSLRIELDPSARTIIVVDNGPGIPFEQGEIVFDPFFTTRPAGQSRGLGLYIARENAKYSGLEIALSETPALREDHYNAFVISWKDEENS